MKQNRKAKESYEMEESNHPKGPPRDSGPEIPMGDCPDCKKPWSMFQSEKDWWDRMARERGYKAPRRCRACRMVRKSQKEHTQPHPETAEYDLRAQIAKHIRDKAEIFISESLDDQQLYNALYELADDIEQGKLKSNS